MLAPESCGNIVCPCFGLLRQPTSRRLRHDVAYCFAAFRCARVGAILARVFGRHRSKLVWTLYVIGSLQIVLLGAAVVGVGYLLHAHPRASPAPAFQRARFRHAGTCPRAEPSFPRAAARPPILAPPLVTFLLSGLVIVGIGSFLTARWIVRPLEALSRAARALGDGDLSARTGLTRTDELGDGGPLLR